MLLAVRLHTKSCHVEQQQRLPRGRNAPTSILQERKIFLADGSWPKNNNEKVKNRLPYA
jgi:hypothetical protein